MLAFAVGLHLSEDETIDLLKSAGYAFSDGSKRDWIVRYLSLIHIFNKRGWVYESKCSDDGNHTEGKSSLYGAYNFMIVSGKDTFGFFIDYPGKVTFDCGYTDLDTLRAVSYTHRCV